MDMSTNFLLFAIYCTINIIDIHKYSMKKNA